MRHPAFYKAIREAEKALGEIRYELTEKEEAGRAFRRSLFAVRDITAGELFNSENVRSIRPGHGLHPRFLEMVLGRRAARDISRGTPLAWNYIGELGV